MYEPEGLEAAAFLLGPLVLALVAVWTSARGHWTTPLLAAPALLLGLALVAALFNNASGPGVLGALFYAPVLLATSLFAIARWRRRPRD